MRVVALLALVLTGGLLAPAQQPASPAAGQEQNRERPEDNKDIDVVYGRIKEVKAGQKIVVHVDNARDKTYDLADKNRTITVAEDLAVGDPVKVLEAKTTKGVQIVRDVRSDSERQEGNRSRK